MTILALHFDISFSALSVGKHVLTDKPFATSLKDGKRLVDEAAARGLSLGSAPDTFLGARAAAPAISLIKVRWTIFDAINRRATDEQGRTSRDCARISRVWQGEHDVTVWWFR